MPFIPDEEISAPLSATRTGFVPDIINVPDEESALREQVIAASQKPLGQRLQERAMLPVNLVQGLLEDIFALPSQLGTGSVALENEPTLSGKLGLLGQSGLEAASRIGTGIDQAILGAFDKVRRAEFSPLGINTRDIFPQRLTEPEIARGVEQLQIQQAEEALKEEGRLAPPVFAERASPELARAGETLSILAPIPGTQVGRAATLMALEKAAGKAAAVPAAIKGAGLRASVTDIATDILNPTGGAEKLNLYKAATSGDLEKAFQETAVGLKKKPKNLGELVKAQTDTLDRLGNQIDEFSKANKDLTVTARDAFDETMDFLSKDPLIETKQAERIIDKYGKFDKDMKLPEAWDLLKRINLEHDAALAKVDWKKQAALADPEFRVLDTLRGSLSGKIDDTIKGVTGLEDNFYRRYGLVKDTQINTTERLVDLFSKRGKEVSEGVVKGGLGKIDLTRPSTYLEPFRFLRGGELGRVNRRVSDLFKRLPRSKPPTKLSDVKRQSLLSRASGSAMQPRGTISMTLEGGSPVDEAIQRSLEVSGLPPATP